MLPKENYIYNYITAAEECNWKKIAILKLIDETISNLKLAGERYCYFESYNGKENKLDYWQQNYCLLLLVS